MMSHWTSLAISPDLPPASATGWLILLGAIIVVCVPAAWWFGRRRALKERFADENLRREHEDMVNSARQRAVELARAKASLERERRLFVGGPVAIFRWIAAEGWPVEYASPNVVGIFGHTAADFTTGRVRYATVVHPEDIARVAQEVTSFSAAGEAFFEQDYRIIRADGETRWLYDFTALTRDETGKITHYEGYVLDITERRRAEDEARQMQARLHHAQKLESLGVLAGGIAHDFNNLLVGVLGNAALAKDEVAVNSPVYESLEHIESAARRAAELAQQMLAYSGRAQLSKTKVNLSELVEQMLDLLKVSISKKAVIVRDIATDLSLVEGDASQLTQVVMNLITNASDAIGDQPGRIVLRSGIFDATKEYFATCHVGRDLPAGRFVSIEVSDDGTGMTSETVARMFDPFFTTKFVGRGLGLASVLGIVKGHQGAICVDSSPGQGTTVRVLLPIAPSPVDDVAGSTPLATFRPVPAGKRILIVDDEPAVRDVVRLFCERLGCIPLVAGDGEQALATLAIAQPPIDCVLLDATMPKLSGEETVRRLHSGHPGLPIILMSGYIESDATRRFRAADLAGFLRKPFTPEELERKLGDLFARAGARRDQLRSSPGAAQPHG